MSLDDDQKLAAAIASGDEDAAGQFDALFRTWAEGKVAKRGVHANDLDDVVQDVLISAIRQLKAGRFRSESSLRTWLTTIIGGKVVDYWRKHPRRPDLISLSSLNGTEIELAKECDQEQVVLVHQALAKLSLDDCVVLLLHKREGLTLEQIAPLMRLGKTAVGDRYKAARQRFRDEIEGGRDGGRKRLKD